MEEHVDTLMGVIFPYANFLMFLAMAIYFFRKPARAAAAAKRASFEKLMAEARSAREAALAQLAELQRREAALHQEIAQIKGDIDAAATQEAAKIVGDAERLAAHLLLEAKRIAEAEVNKARATLRQEIVEAVRAGVVGKIKTELNTEAQHQLVGTKISELSHLRVEH